MTRPARRTGRLALAAFAALMLSAGAYLVLSAYWPGDEGLTAALSQRGRVAVVGTDSIMSLRLGGTELVAADAVDGLTAALAGSDVPALSSALERARVEALLVHAARADGRSLLSRVARWEPIEGLRGLYLSPQYALYAPEPTASLSRAHRDALATVARGLLEGKAPPRVSSFPPPLRGVRHVEVMVLLRRGLRPRLWRSARGSSLARALITASVVARKRWTEREQAMGGALDEVLPQLTVEVSLLADDGTIGSNEPGFVDRVFSREHGVAYEYKGAWRYLLPDATHDKGAGRASQAYRALFRDDGLPEHSFGRPDLRLYRLRVETLAVSEPAPEPRDGLDEVRDPEEVLEAPPAVDGGAG